MARSLLFRFDQRIENKEAIKNSIKALPENKNLTEQTEENGAIDYLANYKKRVEALKSAAKNVGAIYEVGEKQLNEMTSKLNDGYEFLKANVATQSKVDYKAVFNAVVGDLTHQLHQAIAIKTKDSNVSAGTVAEALNVADAMEAMTEPRPVEYTITQNNHQYIIQEDRPVDLSQQEVEELKAFRDSKAPPHGVKDHEFQVIHHYLEGKQDKQLKQFTIPSRLRQIIGTANHSHHRLMFADRSDKKINMKGHSASRTSHPAQRNLLKKAEKEKNINWATENLANALIQAINDMPADEFKEKTQNGPLVFMAQSLTGFADPKEAMAIHDLYEQGFKQLEQLSKNLDKDLSEQLKPLSNNDLAIRVRDRLRSALKGKRSEKKQSASSNDGNKKLPNLVMIRTHHPLNYERWVPNRFKKNRHNQKQLIEHLKGRYQKDSLTYSALQALNTRAYSSVNSRLITEFWDGESAYKAFSHLWDAALEQFIMNKAGISTGFCVSGKDRKGVQLLMADALELYSKNNNNKLPEFITKGNGQGLDGLADCFAELYCSGHQQRNSAFNTYGMTALKNVHMYLPKSFQERINEKRRNLQPKQDDTTHEGTYKHTGLSVKEEGRYAGINDVDKAYKQSQKARKVNRFSRYHSDQAIEFLKVLRKVTDQPDYWKQAVSKFSLRGPSKPNGVQKIESILNDTKQTVDEKIKSIQQVASIKAEDRCSMNFFKSFGALMGRDQKTQHFYQILKEVGLDNLSEATNRIKSYEEGYIQTATPANNTSSETDEENTKKENPIEFS